MGSESTSRFQVKNSKSRKRTKKKDNSKDAEDTDGNSIARFNEQIEMHKKRRGRKRKTDDSELNGTSDEITKYEEQPKGFRNKQNQNDDDSENETPSTKTLRKASATHTDSEQEDKDIDGGNTGKSKKPSKRQLKREKAEKKENEKKEASRIEAIRKGLNYVSKWKHARSEWKFEKLRQIWLMDNLLDEDSIPDDIFPTVLEYFEGCKGMAREQLLKKGMDVIKKIEEEDESKDAIIETVAYKRARKLLQALPTES